LARNNIGDLNGFEDEKGPFETLSKLHDLLLSHNNISVVDKVAFQGLKSLQVL
jgi:hypothetical protein